jgi:hypothetical protein
MRTASVGLFTGAGPPWMTGGFELSTISPLTERRYSFRYPRDWETGTVMKPAKKEITNSTNEANILLKTKEDVYERSQTNPMEPA